MEGIPRQECKTSRRRQRADRGEGELVSTASIRVSVIVPVFNPGDGFDDLIASLDAQSLPSDQFEVLLCDDGSNDETRNRLDAVASTRENVRVFHLPHTGWPGTPRNHGIDQARGTYVFFSDQDDRLFETALESMCDFADANDSDVLVGKVVGVGRRIPRAIFRRDVAQAKLGRDPLLELLTPHKMFRTSFIRDNGIRFPDHKVRLEDHMFVMAAYFRAGVISILASVPIYAWIKTPGSASSARIDPVTYFPHLESVLDIVQANTEPGRMQDTLLRHWYRGKILQRLDGKRVVKWPEEYREQYVDTVTPIAQERFGPGVEAGLAFPMRVRSVLLRGERREDLFRFAQFEASLRCRADITSARWTRGGKLALTIRARITRDGQEGHVFDESAADGAGSAPRQLWHLPADLGEDFLTDEQRDATRDRKTDRIDVLLRAGDVGNERRQFGRTTRNLEKVQLTIDPFRAFTREDAVNVKQLRVDIRRAGWRFEAPLRVSPDIIASLGSSPLLAGRACTLRATENGDAEIVRTGKANGFRDTFARIARVPYSFAVRAVTRFAPHSLQTRLRSVAARLGR